MKSPKPAPFVLISTQHGTMIINRNDYHRLDDNRSYGVGFQLMTRSSYDNNEVQLLLQLLTLRHHYYGAGIIALDCGANIGVHSIEWGNLMTDWGQVYAFEAQEKIYYALAGNIIINNCLNVTAKHVALGAKAGKISIPEPDYLKPASFGSFELKKSKHNEFIGQSIDYDNALKTVEQLSLDSLKLDRADLLKIDVEGMEEEVLEGATELISKHKPILFIEVIKSNKKNLMSFLNQYSYKIFPMGMNLLAIHDDDACLANIQGNNGKLTLTKPLIS